MKRRKIDPKAYLNQMFPGLETELKFHPTRKWKFDYAWPKKKIALEVEGGTWVQGRHTRGKGYESDCCKYSEAAILGWMVIRATTNMMEDGRGLELVERAYKTRQGENIVKRVSKWM